MNTQSSSISTFIQARQLRKLLVSLDLATIAFLLTLLVVGLPLGILLVGQLVDITELPINNIRLALISMVWLGIVVSIVHTIAATVMLSASATVGCAREAGIYLCLSIFAVVTALLSQAKALPEYVSDLALFNQLQLIPLVLLLIYRRVGLQLCDQKLLRNCMAAVNLLVLAVLFFQFARLWSPVSQFLALDPVNALLVGSTISALGACMTVIVWLRVISISFAVRRGLKVQLRSESREQAAEESRVDPKLDPQSVDNLATSNMRWLVFGAIPLVALLELGVASGRQWQKSVLEKSLVQQQQQHEAALPLTDEERAQLLDEATALSNSIWEATKDRTGKVSDEEVQKLDSHAARIRNALFYNTLGIAYYRQGQFQKACERLQMSMALQSFTARKHPLDYGFMAMASRQLGKTQEADKYRQEFDSLMKQPKFLKDDACLSVQKEVQELFGQ